RRLTFGFPHALADALDRVGEDVQELLRLLLVDDQRRDDADDLVARPGADEEGAALLGAADDLLGGGTVRRPVGLDELDADHQPHTAHIPDDPELTLHLAELAHPALADTGGVARQIL